MISKKFKLSISPTCVSSHDIKEILNSKYEIVYCAIYSHDGGVFVYVQNKNNMTKRIIQKLLDDILVISDISVFRKIEGTPLCQSGSIPKRGGLRYKNTHTTSVTNITNNNNSNNPDNRVSVNNFFPLVNVELNPFGKEDIDHISLDDMKSCYINTNYKGIVFNFSDHLFCTKENLNIRCSSKSSMCKAFTNSGWMSEHKDTGYDLIYDNLTQKSLEVMEKFREDIPDAMIAKHEEEVAEMRSHRIDPELEVFDFSKYRNKQLNLVGDNINNMIRNYKTNNGKKLIFP